MDSLDLEKEPWFFGSINRGDSEDLLRSCGHNSFLIRESSIKGCYACSLYSTSTQDFVHTLIVPSQTGGYCFQGTFSFYSNLKNKIKKY